MNLLKGFCTSMSMFSIAPFKAFWEDEYLKWVMATLNVVGLVIGFLWYLLVRIVLILPINIELKSLLIFIVPLFLTGFIHMDGLIDTCDSVFSRADLEKRRKILKDPNTGAFGVIAIVLYMLFGYAIGTSIISNEVDIRFIIFIPFASRFISSIYLVTKPTYSKNGFAETFRKDMNWQQICFMFVSTVLTLGVGIFFLGLNVLIIFLVIIFTGVIVGEYVTKQLEGISGDLCGFIIAICELVGYFIISVI